MMTCRTCHGRGNCPHILTRRVILALLAGLPCPYWLVRVLVLPPIGLGLADRPAGEVGENA